MNVEAKERIALAMSILSAAVNCNDSTEVGKVMAKEFLSTHRTLQQAQMLAIKVMLAEYAEFVTTDGRNERAKVYAAAVSSIDVALPFI